MRTTRTIFAALFAVALALPFAACNGDEGAFEETPPAEEEVYEEEQQPMEQQPMQERPMDETTPEGGTMEQNP